MTLQYVQDELSLGGFPLTQLTAKAQTPFYVYDLDSVGQRLELLNKSLQGARVSVHYAVKTNSHQRVLKFIAEEDMGADVVSGGELTAALEAGFPAHKIIFSGVGKSAQEIKLALQRQIRQLNVESPQELERIGEMATQLGVRAPVAFRMNPDVNPQTHPYITTGFRENKFGMDETFLPELEKILLRHKSLKLVGLTQHIGSQLLDLGAFEEAVSKIVRIYKELQAKGYELESVDLGGGVGIDYSSGDEEQERALLARYGAIAAETSRTLNCEVLLEPGRSIAARAGVLICQVEYIKETDAKNFAIVNTGMHHLLRPALYQAYHRILPLQLKEGPLKVYDVVGPICESSDFLGRDRPFHSLQQGDFLAIADSGAYGRSMASTYNLHELPQEFIVRKGQLE